MPIYGSFRSIIGTSRNLEEKFNFKIKNPHARNIIAVKKSYLTRFKRCAISIITLPCDHMDFHWFSMNALALARIMRR